MLYVAWIDGVQEDPMYSACIRLSNRVARPKATCCMLRRGQHMMCASNALRSPASL